VIFTVMVRIAAPKNNLQNSVLTEFKSEGGDEPFTGKAAIGYDGEIFYLGLALDPAYIERFIEGCLERIGEDNPNEERLFRALSTSCRRSKVCVSRSSTPTMWEKHTGSPSCTTCMARSTSPPIRC
jgi:hypothetical protein